MHPNKGEENEMRNAGSVGSARRALFGKLTMLMAPEADPKGGAGGEPDDDKPLTRKEAIALIGTEVGKSVNGAMKDHSKRITADITKTFDEKLAGFGEKLEQIGEKLTAAPPPPPDDKGEKGKGGGDKGNLPPEILAELKQLRENQGKLEKRSKEAEDARAQAEKKALINAERTALSEALIAKGIKKTMLPSAVALLYVEKQRIRTTEEGKRVFKNDDGEELPLEDGVAEWLKGEEGLEYMPPRSAGGAGSGPSKGGSSNPNAPMSDKDFVAKIGL